MKTGLMQVAAATALSVAAATLALSAGRPLAVRGLYLAAPKPDEIPLAVQLHSRSPSQRKRQCARHGIRLQVFLRQPP